MSDPLFWLILSLVFVTASLTIVLVVAIPTLKELTRAARSATKLFETLRREFPPALQAIKMTGHDISDLTNELNDGVQSAGHVVKQFDDGIVQVRRQASRTARGTQQLWVGMKTAWKTFTNPKQSTQRVNQRRPIDRLPPSVSTDLTMKGRQPDTVATRNGSRPPESEYIPPSNHLPTDVSEKQSSIQE